MNGGLGNDLYIVDNAGDVAAEVAGGIDTVQSSVTHTLSANLENLTLTGAGDDQRHRQQRCANTLTGNSGNNALDGGDRRGHDGRRRGQRHLLWSTTPATPSIEASGAGHRSGLQLDRATPSATMSRT